MGRRPARPEFDGEYDLCYSIWEASASNLLGLKPPTNSTAEQKAAVRAARNAIEFNSLPAIRRLVRESCIKRGIQLHTAPCSLSCAVLELIIHHRAGTKWIRRPQTDGQDWRARPGALIKPSNH